MEQESIEKMIYDETENRLTMMESYDYEFPKQINGKDIIGIVVAVGVSLLLIVLCITGVIV